MHKAGLERIRAMKRAPWGSSCLTNVPTTHPVRGSPAKSAPVGDFSPRPPLDPPPPTAFSMTLAKASQSAFGSPGAHLTPCTCSQRGILNVEPDQATPLLRNIQWLPSAKGNAQAVLKVIHDLAATTLPVSPATTSLHEAHTLVTRSLATLWLLGFLSGTSPVTHLSCSPSACRGSAPPPLDAQLLPTQPPLGSAPLAFPQRFPPLCVLERGLYFCYRCKACSSQGPWACEMLRTQQVPVCLFFFSSGRPVV